VLAQFVADATKGTLPQVSWIVAPYEYSEHPAASPSYGAHYVRTVLEALMGNQDLSNTTARCSSRTTSMTATSTTCCPRHPMRA
jgi:phospholipase C